MARIKKEQNTIAYQIGEVRHSIMGLRNQLEDIKKKIKEKEAELEQLEQQQKLETMNEIIKIAEHEGVTIDTLLAALQRDKSLLGLIADEAKNNIDEEEDIIEDTNTSAENVSPSEPVVAGNVSTASSPISQFT